MKRVLVFLTVYISFFQAGLCSTQSAGGEELSSALKNSSHEPNFFSVLIALIFVICLIYITGLIYSKLNIAGARVVKEQMENQDLSGVVVLSTTQLGQGKNIHVIEINKQRLLIGATPNSINLIKELDSSAEIILTDKSKEPKAEDSFDIHKKYL